MGAQQLEKNHKLFQKILNTEEGKKEIQKYFRNKFVYSTNNIEDNVFSIADVRYVLKNNTPIDKQYKNSTHETLGSIDSYNYMFKLKNKNSITTEDLLNFHALFAFQMPNSLPGKFRDNLVKITGRYSGITTYFCPPSDILPRLDRIFKTLDVVFADPNKSVFEKAGRLHTLLVNIHPFKDGNGRVCRLAMNTFLLQNGYAPVIFSNSEKETYLRLMDRVSNNLDVNFKELTIYDNGKKISLGSKTANLAFFDLIESAEANSLEGFLEYYKKISINKGKDNTGRK